MSTITIFEDCNYSFPKKNSFLWNGNEEIGFSKSILRLIEDDCQNSRQELFILLLKTQKTISEIMTKSGYVSEVDRLLLN